MEEKESWNKRLKGFFTRPLVWLRRGFRVGKELDGELSPKQLRFRRFLKRKTAVFALSILLSLFLFVFIAPTFVGLDMNYTDPLQQNVPPSYSLRSLPKSLKKSVKDIKGFSDFTVGLSTAGKVFVWGNTKNKLNGLDLKKIPKDMGEVELIAAGKDHILAFTKEGKLFGWGDKSCGQYGGEPVLNALSMPQEVLKLKAGEAQSLVCGYQVSGLVTTVGKGYVWGNKNALSNLESVAVLLQTKKVEKILFTNSAAVVLTRDGEISTGSEEYFTSCIGQRGGKKSSLNGYLHGRKVKDIATSNKCLAILTEDDELVLSGVFENGEDRLPTLKEGEYFQKITGGGRHFVGITNLGKAYAWGHNGYGQCDLNGAAAQGAYAGSLQTYLVDGN